MEVRVNSKSQVGRLISSLEVLHHGAESKARIDIDHAIVEDDGHIRFCAVSPTSLNVRSSEKLRNPYSKIIGVRLHGVEVQGGCQLTLQNIKLRSEPKESHGGHILILEADKESQVCENTGKNKNWHRGYFGDPSFQKHSKPSNIDTRQGKEELVSEFVF